MDLSAPTTIGTSAPQLEKCTRDDKCVNHDWSHVDKKSSPFKVMCVKGPGCENHDWNGRSPMAAEPS